MALLQELYYLLKMQFFPQFHSNRLWIMADYKEWVLFRGAVKRLNRSYADQKLLLMRLVPRIIMLKNKGQQANYLGL